MSRSEPDPVDVLIVGAGLSGIGAAVHLQQRCPDRRFAIVEARDRLGGTWDLFRYPGIRSDSDMYTMGYRFAPWPDAKAIADGASILAYLQATAREHGVDRHIRYGQRVTEASWSTADACWTVQLEAADGSRHRLRAGFLLMCPGYYRYDRGHRAALPGIERFAGRVVHPQFWPQDLDTAGQRIVIVGSGATAVTLLPALAQTAAHVTMLQRSPTWIVSRPSVDRLAEALRRWLPAGAAYTLNRWKRVLLGMYFYRLCRRKPQGVGRWLLEQLKPQLPPGFDIERHFHPRYNPWEQRLCLVPDGDFFRAIREGRASVATDTIETFTERGIRLASGEELPANVVVTATGLELQVLGGAQLVVDGRPVDPAQCVSYKAMMLSGVPNLASITGYTNASWTLKADLSAEYVCRLLNHLRRRGLRQCTPTLTDPDMPLADAFDFSSGYIRRALHLFPKRGMKAPWLLKQNYIHDLLTLRHGRIDDGALVFSSPAAPQGALAAAE
ncbi:MAG: NAD(P)/FAD-dependent oxidoreductase [Burkholderiales bacterium]|nr:NAD(P)/FAD-dependent oxidoreductase [Burkholderiales bacterium]